MSIEDLASVRLSTASRHLTDARKAPAPVTVITRDEIRRFGWRTLAELLRSSTSLYTAYDRSYSYLGVRGFLQSGDYNARVLLLIDGHRVNDEIYDSALIGSEFPLDMDLIERVEIARGPGSSLYGTDAELAVINVFTREPERRTTVELVAGAGSFSARQVALQASFATSRLAGQVSLSGFRSNGAYRMFFPEYDLPGLNGGLATNLDGDRYDHLFGKVRSGGLRVEGLLGRRDKIVPNASFQTTFGDPRNRTMDTVGYIDASYSRNLAGHLQFDARAYFDPYRFRGSCPYTGGGDSSGVQINDAMSDTAGIEAIFSWTHRQARFVAGVVTEHSFRIRQRNYYFGMQAYLDDRRTLDHDALFVEAEVNPSPRVSLNVGGRLDWYGLDGTALSPRIAIMFFPKDSISLKYIFSHAFRAPDPYDIFYVDDVDLTSTNHALKPENVNAHTLMFERRFDPHTGVEVSGFVNVLNDIIKEQNLQGNTHFVNGRGDIGRGVEVEMTARYPAGWGIRSSYTFSQTRGKDGSGPVMNSPAHLGKFNGSAPLGAAAFLGAEFQLTGPQFNFLGRRIDSSTLMNATLTSHPFAHGLELSAGCYNFFNRRGATPTGPEVASPATIQDGRTWRFLLTYRSLFERK